MKLAIFVLFLGVALAGYRMMQDWAPIGDMDCLGNEFDVFLMRGYKGTCAVDKNAKSNFQKCHAVKPGMCAFYISPVSKCDAEKAVNDFCDQVIVGTNIRFAIFVEIADPPNWGSDTSENRAWLEKLVQALAARVNDCVYWIAMQTNKWEWEKIFGADYTTMSQYRLLWEFIDHDPNFDPSTWTNFGGWTRPFSKQYARGEDVCDQPVDKDTWQVREEDEQVEFNAPVDG